MTDAAPPPIRVLQSFRGAGARTNPYLLELVRSLPSDVAVDFFSWRRALFGRYDVLHVHWPELLLRGRSRLRRAARRIQARMLLVRLARGRPRLVRTLHNIEAHERVTRADERVLRALDEATTLFIRLNPGTPVPTARPVVTIPHGHYRDWYAAHAVPAAEPGRLAAVGLIRPYKRIPELIAAFAGVPGAGLRLSVVGDAPSPDLARDVREAAARDPRVDLRLGHATDADLATEIGRAELIVLGYRRMHNSGAALLALSLDRPVLVPDNDVTRDLAGEVGEGWVLRFAGDLDSAALATALADLERTRPARGGRPDLSRRDWPQLGAAHADAYRATLRSARAGRHGRMAG